jgi:hypothetical protein
MRRRQDMKWIRFLLIGFVVVITLACSSPENRAYRAQEKMHTERLRLVDEYKKCLKEAGNDKEKVEACDQYLKAAEALK